MSNKPLTIEAALQQAFEMGTQTADGYRSALCGMGSRRNLDEGDTQAARAVEVWAKGKAALAKRVKVGK